MKRSDLIVGQEYLVHDSNDWNTGKGWGAPARYRLISLDKVAEDTRRGYQRTGEDRRVRVEWAGTEYPVKNSVPARSYDKHTLAVMVRLENKTGHPSGEQPLAVLVPFAKVRAPWAEGIAVISELERRAAERKATQNAALQERTTRARTISERAALLGLRIQPSASSAATMAVAQDVLDALLALAEEGQQARTLSS